MSESSKKPNFKAFFVALTLIVVLFLGIYIATSKKSNNLSNPISRSSDEAYNFILKDLQGRNVSLSEYYDKVIILNFWDTWCPPCKAEIPDFIDLYSNYNRDGVEIIGIAMGREGKPAVEKFVKKYNINYPILLADNDVISGYGGISAIPTTFVISKDRKIYKKYVGFNEKSVFKKDIETLLAK